MEKIFESRWFSPAAVLVLAVSIVIVYSNTFHASFQFDDQPQITAFRPILDLDNLGEILTYPRGITIATFALNYAWGGFDTFGYHLVNTLIHIINAALAYFFVASTLVLAGGERPWARRIAFFSAALFALHPVQTQAVTYIVQRMESLTSLFYLLGMLFFIKAASGKERNSATRLVFYVFVAVSYILGFYSKEVAITLPLMLVAYDYLLVSGLKPAPVLRRFPLYVVMALMLVYFAVSTIAPLGGFGDTSAESAVTGPRTAATVAQHGGAGTEAGTPPRAGKGATAGFQVEGVSPKNYLFTQFNVIVYYIVLLAYPAGQNLDYDFPVADGLFSTPWQPPGARLLLPAYPPVISLVLLVLIAGAALWLVVRSGRAGGAQGRLIPFFILWFFVLIAPTSSFIPIADVIYEHRIYLASLGLFTVFVLMVDRMSVRLFAGVDARRSYRSGGIEEP